MATFPASRSAGNVTMHSGCWLEGPVRRDGAGGAHLTPASRRDDQQRQQDVPERSFKNLHLFSIDFFKTNRFITRVAAMTNRSIGPLRTSRCVMGAA